MASLWDWKLQFSKKRARPGLFSRRLYHLYGVQAMEPNQMDSFAILLKYVLEDS